MEIMDEWMDGMNFDWKPKLDQVIKQQLQSIQHINSIPSRDYLTFLGITQLREIELIET